MSASSLRTRHPPMTVCLDYDYLDEIRRPLVRALAIAELSKLACVHMDVQPASLTEALEAIHEGISQALRETRPLLLVLTGAGQP
jgi:predicted kinase